MDPPELPFGQARHEQMYPTLDPGDVERVSRFGRLHAYLADAAPPPR
jgi:hypothetical protein